MTDAVALLQLPGNTDRAKSRRVRHSIAALTILALVAGFPFAVRAEDKPRAAAAAAPAYSPIEYRRIFVPADRMEAWPRDGEKLIPIESRDFDEWVRAANGAAAQSNQVAINTADYSAHLDNDGQLRGEGRWTIVARSEKPTFLPLGNLSLVIQNAEWQDAPQKPARIGAWGQNNRRPNQFGLEVVRSGTLQFEWHVQTHSADDQIELPWLVPAANSTRLTLELPEGKQPRVDGGVVLESTLRPSDDRSPGKPLRRWVIGLSPDHGTTLRIVSADRKPSQADSQTILHEEVDYRIGPRGLEITTTWILDGLTDPKREIAVAVPPGLQLSSIKSGKDDLAWRLMRDPSSLTDTALLDLPKSNGSKQLQITINAWQPAIVDAPWRLPRLRPEGVFWSSGKFELSVAAAYELRRLNLSDCIETSTSHLAATENAPEAHSFTANTPSAAIEVNLSDRQTDATIRSGSSLTLADPNLNGRLVTQWNLSHGAAHRLVGKLSPGWIVEALETIPADAMADWFIDRRGNDQQIEIQLSRAATTTRNVTVVVTARLQRFNLAEPISAHTMKIVNWEGAKPARHLLTFQSNEPYAVAPVGNLPEVGLDVVDTNDRELLDQSMDNEIFDITEAANNAGVQLAVRPGKFAAHINQELTYDNDVLRQTFRVVAEPSSGPIDHLLIYATNPLGDSVHWTNQSTNTSVAAEKLAQNDPQRTTLPKNGEVWLLRFSQPISRSVEIVANLSSKRPENALVPLLFLPEAAQQDARILVRCRNQGALWFESSRLQTAPVPSSEAASKDLNDSPPVRAAYSYQPANCRDPALAPKLSASAIPDAKSVPLIARDVRLESFLWPDGSGAHCAKYELDAHGAVDFKLDVPTGARLVSASLDGNALDLTKPTQNGQPAIIHLVAQTRPTRLSLYLDTHDLPLAAGRELTAPAILSDLPFIAGDWTVWLPEEYSATGTGLSDSAPVFNWRERVFGVLGRPAGSRPFNPFRLADGAELVNGLADGNALGSPTSSSSNQSQVSKPNENTSGPSNPTQFPRAPTAGWRRYHESFVAGPPAAITVIHPARTTAWSVALLLGSFLCGRWVRHRNAEAFILLLAIAAASALLLPFAYASLASGAVLGLILSLVADWPGHWSSTYEPIEQSRPNAAITIALAIVFAASFARLGHAQTPQSTSDVRSATNKIYRVMIPTDAQGHAVGTKYYISDEFLRALTAAVADSSQIQGQWLLSDAAYTGEIAESHENKGSDAGNWTLSFSAETLARDTTVTLPLVQSEAEWSSTAMLDGVPLPLEWQDAGRSCSVQIPEPGRYSLSVSCVPKTTTVEGHNQLELKVPKVSGAKIDVRYPDTVTGVTVAGASIIPPTAGSPNTLRAELDETNRLHVQWSRSDKSENGTTGLSITEMRWLNVKPAGLEITVKYVLEGGARRPDAISVTYDDRWKLLSSERSLNAKSSTAASQHTIRIPVSAQSTDRQELSLRWRLVDPTVPGNLRLPPIELASIQPTKRWLAMSNDASLDCEVLDASALDGTASEFLAKWGSTESNEPPDWVLSNFDSHSASNLAIRPRETETIVDESLNAAAGLTALRANYEATLTPGLAGANRVELSVPANLAISQVAVTEDDRPIHVRWSRSAKTRVSVFFAQHLTKPYRLVLDGSMPVDADGKATLPRISTLATVDATQKTRLYRDDNVSVEFEGLPAKNDPKTDPPGPAPSEWPVRPVAICYLESDSANARVAIKPNRLKLTGDSITNVARENGEWWVNYRCQLLVEDGNLDILRLRLPATCVGPFDVQSANPVTTELKSADGELSSLLSIRLATTVVKGGNIDLRVRSPLKASNGAQVSVPAITVESLASGHRYIGVPESADTQAATWTETGVRPAALPQKLRPATPPPTTAHFFEIVSDPFQVASRPPAVPEVAPQIRLADTAIVADDLGAQRVTTRLILAPHGITDCTIQLPPKQTLVSVELDGRPAVVRQLDPSQWQVSLAAPELPQSLQIVSRVSADNTNVSSTDLVRPALLAHGQSIPAEMSLWSLAHPQRSVSRVVAGADQVTAVEQAALRFDRLVSIAEAARAAAAELPPPDGYNWFVPWANLLTAARAATQHTNAAPPLERVESQVSHTAEDQITQAAGRLDKWLDDGRKTLLSPQSSKSAATPPAAASTISSQEPSPAADEWTYYVAEGGSDHLELRFRQHGPTPNQKRIIGLLAIAGALIAAIWLMRRPAALDFFYRWPHAVGVLVGIAYWGWLWPSWLGILIAAASLWLALRFAWPGQSVRTEASTVLRASRTN